MLKLHKMQFHGFNFPLVMVRSDKACIKLTLPRSIVMRKHEKYVYDVLCAFEKGTTQTLGAVGNAVKSGLDEKSFF